jgi:CubicO group peptidase (beta-lactamase class C family)
VTDVVLSQPTRNRVDELVVRIQAEGRAPSLVAAVVRDAQVAHMAMAGETPAPHRDLQYRIGSISKTLTAAVLLGLRDEGRLRLDDALGDHLKGLPAAVASRRLRDLLGMAGGMQREPDGEWWERSAGVTLPELIARLHDGKVAFGPFDRYHYSNLGYGLLGGVIAKVTGETWYDAVSQRILRPLGMSRTTHGPQEPFARGYVAHPWHGTLHEEPRHDSAAMAPAGQLWSTAVDLARWAAVLASAPSPVAAQPAAGLDLPFIGEMAAPVIISDPQAWTAGYGLGVQLFRRGERVFVGHTGSMPGYLAILLAHRPTRTAVVAFTNTYTLVGHTIGGAGLAILEAVLDNEPTPAPAPWRPVAQPPPPEIAPMCGRWWWMGREYQAHYDARSGHFVMVSPRAGIAPSTFVAESRDVWRGVSGDEIGELLQVIRDEAGDVVALNIATFSYTRHP